MKDITMRIIVILCILIPISIIGYISNLNEEEKNKETESYLVNGTNCFVNGVLCKNISCDMPGGCYAKECVGGAEYSGALRIKCIELNRL